MNGANRFDPSTLFGRQVVDESGRRLGRISALIHRADGCDVLVERRGWRRRAVLRLDLDDLAEGEGDTYRHVRRQHRSTGPGDDRVA